MSSLREGGSRELRRKTKMLLALSIPIAVTLLGTVVFLNLRADESRFAMN